jgi:hypothetical protein
MPGPGCFSSKVVQGANEFIHRQSLCTILGRMTFSTPAFRSSDWFRRCAFAVGAIPPRPVLSLNIRANITYSRPDSRGRGRVQLAAELPLLYTAGRWPTPPEVNYPAPVEHRQTSPDAFASRRSSPRRFCNRFRRIGTRTVRRTHATAAVGGAAVNKYYSSTAASRQRQVPHHITPQSSARRVMNIVEYFQSRQREVDDQLQAIESGRIIRLICETKDGSVDVTEQEKQRLRTTSHDYWRAAENLKRINSSQK